MLSDSARATSAIESQFRVQTANSRPRRVRVIALDPASSALGPYLSEQHWQNFRFVNFDPAESGENPAFGSGEVEADAYDFLVVVGTVGSDLRQATRIAEFAKIGVEISSVLIAPKRAKPNAVRDALLTLRPISRTLAVIRDAELLRGMLQALGD